MFFYLFLLTTFLDTIYNDNRMIEWHGVRKQQDIRMAGTEKGQGRRLGWWQQVLVYDNNDRGKYLLCFASISSWQGTVTWIQSQARLCHQPYQSLSCWSKNLWVLSSYWRCGEILFYLHSIMYWFFFWLFIVYEYVLKPVVVPITV